MGLIGESNWNVLEGPQSTYGYLLESNNYKAIVITYNKIKDKKKISQSSVLKFDSKDETQKFSRS
jgi:hypothetical protein